MYAFVVSSFLTVTIARIREKIKRYISKERVLKNLPFLGILVLNVWKLPQNGEYGKWRVRKAESIRKWKVQKVESTGNGKYGKWSVQKTESTGNGARGVINKTAQKIIEESVLTLPTVQYAWIEGSEIEFSERVREICRRECPRYGTSWACPPAVGTVEQCRERCARYEGAFVFTTVAEVADIENMQETLATRHGHEEVTEQIREIFRAHGFETMALSGDSCARCRTCTYPDGPCRHLESLIPCVEGFGIVVPLLAEKAGIAFDNGGNTVTWFGVILFTNLP